MKRLLGPLICLLLATFLMCRSGAVGRAAELAGNHAHPLVWSATSNVPDVTYVLQTSLGREVQPLEPGPPLQRNIEGSKSHTYVLRMLAGQYLRIAVQPRGTGLRLRLLTPQGATLLDLLAPNTAQEPTRLSLIAQDSGSYLAEISSTRNEGTRQYAIGIEDLHDAVSLDRDRVAAETLFAEANSRVAAGRSDALVEAVGKYREALAAWRRLKEQREEARTLLNLGAVLHSLSRWAEALDHYAQALAIWRVLGDRGKEAQTLSGIGWTYYGVDELERALQNYNLALPIRREIKDLRGQAQTLTTIGQIYRSLGEPQQAIKYFEQALPLARQAGDKIQEAFALNSYAFLYIELNEYEKAIDYLERALLLWRENGQRYGEADALNSLGIVYRNLGDFEKSLDYYEGALKLYRFVGNRQGEGDALNNIGTVYWSKRMSPEALDYLNQALALRKLIGQKSGEAGTLGNLGLVYEELGEQDKALDHFTRALAITPTNAVTLGNLARNCYLRGDSPRAIEYARRALAIFREKSEKGEEAGMLGLIAEVQASQGLLDEALANGRTALEMFETLRARLIAPERRTSMHGFSKSYYSLVIDILSELHQQHPADGYDAAALEISERARSRGLLDLLREAHIDIRQRVDPVLLDRERTLQQQLNSKEQYRTHLVTNKRADAERADAEKEIASLAIDYENTLAKIRASSPEYAALTQPDTLRLKELQQTVVDENSILLEYYLGSQSSLWAVTPTSITWYKLPSTGAIQTAARQVYTLLVARNAHPSGETPEQRLARVNEADARYEDASEKLSEILLQPVAAQLGKKRLLLVTDGILQYIPFSALPAPRIAARPRSESHRQPLIVDHEIVNLPSASVLALLRKELVTRRVTTKTLAVFADPVFSRDDPRVLARQESRPGQQGDFQGSDKESDSDPPESKTAIPRFGRLRFSREEADGIAALAAKSELLEATDFAATKEVMVSANLQQYRILHFATHSWLNNRWPELSGVVLSLVDRKGEPQDGFLRLNEIYNLRLNADLVVLSGCQTALGKAINGEGLVGLARGFMYAGAPRVVASLWSIDDRATAELMKRFYKAVLTKRIPPAAALRVAQIDLLSDHGWHAPYYWAAFTLQGEWK